MCSCHQERSRGGGDGRYSGFVSGTGMQIGMLHSHAAYSERGDSAGGREQAGRLYIVYGAGIIPAAADSADSYGDFYDLNCFDHGIGKRIGESI